MSDVLSIEALLFAYGKRVNEEELSKIMRWRIDKVKRVLQELKNEISNRESSLELINEESFWKLTVKDDYLELVKNIVTKTELDRPTLETLAVIAFKYPVLQSEVINIRNASAYEHIKVLVEFGYVIKEKTGRSFKLKLTPKFFEYFDLPKKKLKEAFKDVGDVTEAISNVQT